jgi:protein-S-isoprenylcysteine O-methyltransferase Ste14
MHFLSYAYAFVACAIAVWVVFAINVVLFEPRLPQKPRTRLIDKLMYSYNDHPFITIVVGTIMFVGLLKAASVLSI